MYTCAVAAATFSLVLPSAGGQVQREAVAAEAAVFLQAGRRAGVLRASRPGSACRDQGLLRSSIPVRAPLLARFRYGPKRQGACVDVQQ
ncbi:hypothetical protein COCMIDRAFT_3543 [Bipolaris oryzae ATCC 44560]|uniref:Secreted protein n=1 Tax=Bipolaris oryzae ATCC 44560 TaxID=930090 RepID=W6ZBU2_COCMI|nr:uncharacterized protein COCMIDRAFT_3543 [Bipolaris oryzae ATCC 44560]EUC47450.1 hypothetical protein COCMIDRAFT_3543 [Bipolaris oryzae ATCC 44560]